MSDRDPADCPLCGGSGEVELTPFGKPDSERDSFGCPACIAAERDEEIASLKAKLVEAEKDAGRYRYIKGLARKSEAYDKFTGYHWQVGFFDPKCVGFDSAIDAMIRGRA